MNGDGWYDLNIFSLCIVYFPSSFDFFFLSMFILHRAVAQGLMFVEDVFFLRNPRDRQLLLHIENGLFCFHVTLCLIEKALRIDRTHSRDSVHNTV